jgi:DNA-binding transcriptional regulator YhcF (GntR family)
MEGNPMNDAKLQSTSIQVMSRMFSLLDTLAGGQEAVSLKYIATQTGLHPSTAHRILNDLAAGRYVERAGPGFAGSGQQTHDRAASAGRPDREPA